MDLDAAAVEAAAVVKELFGYACENIRIGATLDPIECGNCPQCRRDWRPEADAILSAAAPFIARVTADAIADKIEAEQKRLYRATVHHRQLRADEAATIARSHGSQVVASPGGQDGGRETVQAETTVDVAETPVQPVNSGS